ncbi:MAG: hypothetical protein IKX78_01675, partial [Clostridia bacterium]|nr:hypothetical protein [Clostridia bacterium]
MKKILSLIIALALLMSFPSALVWAEGEPVLTSSGVLRLEAESYQSQVAATIVQNDASASGGKRLNFTSNLSAATNLDFKVNVVTAGRYKVTVKWGTDSGNANSKILINGEEKHTCESGFNQNKATVLEVDFSAGINTVTVANNGWGRTLWVDYAEFSGCAILPAGGTLKLEAESFASATVETSSSWGLSGGVRIANSEINFRFDAEAAGTYELKVRWGEKNSTNTISVKVNGTAITPEFNTFSNWWSGTAYANITLVQGENLITVDQNANIWVDYIQINPVPTLTASSPLRLEAEDYHKGYGMQTRVFTDGAYIFNNNSDKVTTFKAKMNVQSSGRYAIDLCAGGYSSNLPELTVNIDDTPVYTGTVAASTDSTPSAISTYGTGVGIRQSTVDLTAGQHTVSVDLPANSKALMDYIEFTKIADLSDEVYSYELEDYNVDGGDLSAALVKTYLGNYDPADASTKENASLKALGEGL